MLESVKIIETNNGSLWWNFDMFILSHYFSCTNACVSERHQNKRKLVNVWHFCTI